MKRIIDLETWERRDNFNFFRTFRNPTISVTSEVECGGAKARAKAEGRSFFLHYLYAILRAANEIKEIRYRINRQDQVELYDRVDAMAPIKVNDQGKFMTVRLSYQEDFEAFYQESRQLIQALPKDGDPYAEDNQRQEATDADLGVINVSAVPDLFFTAVTTAQQHRNGNDYPLITAGKVVTREGKQVMPIAIAFHHGLVDGHHITQFFKKIEELLK